MVRGFTAVLFATLLAVPALAADKDLHAAHHPQAVPAARPAPAAGIMEKCPMMRTNTINSPVMKDNGSAAADKAMNCSMMNGKAASRSSSR